jgi:putative FmdB family regulatory protein
MPTYEYRCEKCQSTFELFQSMKDAAVEVCPKEKCLLDIWGRGKVKRLLGTGAGLIFKGSGFYVTDYRSPSYQESAKKESSAKEGGAKEGGGAKTDSGAAKSGGGGSSTGGGAGSSSNKPAN